MAAEPISLDSFTAASRTYTKWCQWVKEALFQLTIEDSLTFISYKVFSSMTSWRCWSLNVFRPFLRPKVFKMFSPKKKQKCFPLAPSIPSFIELLCDHSWTYINIYLAGGHIQHGHTGILWIISLSHLLALRCEGNLRRHGSGTAFRALLQGLGHSSQVQGQSLHHLKRSVLENSAEPLIRFNLSICNKW